MIRFSKAGSHKEISGQLGMFLVWLLVTVIAALLHPSPEGHGTHTELGLPPCPSVVLFGRPCPGCGLTTSFTNLIHGNVAEAFRDHAFGPILYLMLTVAGVMSLVCYWRKLRIDTSTRWFQRASGAFVAVFLLFGIARFILSPHYGDGDPVHRAFAVRTNP